MATYFISNGGSNTSPYDTWAKAATTIQTALTAASTDGDIVVLQYNNIPTTDGYMQLWDYADYAFDDYVPGNEEIKLSSLSELPAALLEFEDLTRFAVVDFNGVTTEVYNYDSCLKF